MKLRFTYRVAYCEKDNPKTSALTNIVGVCRDPALLTQVAFSLESGLDIRQ